MPGPTMAPAPGGTARAGGQLHGQKWFSSREILLKKLLIETNYFGNSFQDFLLPCSKPWLIS